MNKVLLAWIHGQITDNEFALLWQAVNRVGRHVQ